MAKWASEAYREHKAATMLTSKWKPPEQLGKYKQVSAIFTPMVERRDGGVVGPG